MAEMVIRTGKRRKKGMLDQPARRWPISAAQAKMALKTAGEAAPGLLLGMADVMGIPSGFYAAYITALAALDKPFVKPVCGVLTAMLLRWVSGMPPRWECMITLALLWLAPAIVHGRGNLVMMGFVSLTSALGHHRRLCAHRGGDAHFLGVTGDQWVVCAADVQGAQRADSPGQVGSTPG